MNPKPTITARLVRDADRQPQYVVDATGTRHFRIELAIDGAPDDASRVLYQLHESYFEPIPAARPDSPPGTALEHTRFAQEITSYGDCELTARIETPRGPCILRERLSRALRRGENNADDQPAPVDTLRAIEDVLQGINKD